MSLEKAPLPDEIEDRDKTSYDIIKSCFGDEDGFEAAVFAKKSQIENETGKKVKIDKSFVDIIFEDYLDKELLKKRSTVFVAHIKGILEERKAKNFGMDGGSNDGDRESAFNSEIHKKGAYYHEKRQGLKEDD